MKVGKEGGMLNNREPELGCRNAGNAARSLFRKNMWANIQSSTVTAALYVPSISLGTWKACHRHGCLAVGREKVDFETKGKGC